jgi:hypothetical protein
MKNPWLKLSGIGLAALLGVGAPAVALAGGDADAKFKSTDTNSDGKVSETEFVAVADRKFVEIDANRDGRVTVMEMDNYKARIHKDKQKADKGWDTRYTSSEKIKKMDTNGDGSVTEVEFRAGATTKFGEMDTNHDAFLTKSELEAGHAKEHKGSGK